jgi:nucleoid DNA-binding protein
MEDKITFEEIIASTAQQIDQSKTFTNDFLHNLLSTIKKGLLQDEKVHIAGFGKFELEQVEAREGYNPQTEKPMTIPAHKKVVFKPYKKLREAVNKPYAHLEPQLLKENDARQPPSYIPKAAPADTNSSKDTSSSKITPDNRMGWIAAGVGILAAGVAAWLLFKDE